MNLHDAQQLLEKEVAYCPVCEKQELPAMTVQCPNCGSELKGFAFIRAIEHQQELMHRNTSVWQARMLRLEAELRRKSMLNSRLTILATLSLVLALGLGLRTGCSSSAVPQAVHLAQIEALDRMVFERDSLVFELQQRNRALGNMVDTLLAASPISGYRHVVAYGESFHAISRAYFGDEAYAQQIAQYNNRLINSFIFVGDTLAIPARPNPLAE